MASLFLSSLVILLFAVSATESAVADVIPVHAFQKTSNHAHVYPLNMPSIPEESATLERFAPPSGVNDISAQDNVYPLNMPSIPEESVMPEGFAPPSGVNDISAQGNVYPLNMPSIPESAIPDSRVPPSPRHAIQGSRKIKILV
ncbi:unnamed protein product [Vicia faba]|uniref:Uncharacterized protein n=1 Tax=Vicia faba TaxID=3906 RepID=A0AAV0Z2W2_VICFA|nr:unnamed protein product [Vicia faba]